MGKSTKYGLSFIFFLSFLPQKNVAQQVSEESNSPFYLTAGYSLNYELYHHQQITVTDITPPFTYTIQNTYPNNFSGMRFGFGSRFGSSESHYGYEFAFDQVFAKTKNTPGLEVTRSEKIIAGFVTYTINPKSKLQWILAGGGIITTISLTTNTTAPNAASSSSSTTTSVDPSVAGTVLYHINSMFAVKSVLIYKIAPYDTQIRGSIIPLLMVNYYPKIFN